MDRTKLVSVDECSDDPSSSGTGVKYTVTVIGNSNSVMSTSYARVLERSETIKVLNCSIGDCTNVLLLDFLARLKDSAGDVIIVETCVVDVHWNRQKRIDRIAVRRNLIQFLVAIRARSSARILLLILPIRSVLLTEDTCWAEQDTLDVAAIYGADVLNVYALLRSMLATPSGDWISSARSATIRLLTAAGLPTHDWISFLWMNGLRSQQDNIGPLLRHAFQNELHLGDAFHALIARLISCWLERSSGSLGLLQHDPSFGHPFLSFDPCLSGGMRVQRSSKLLTRDFMVANSGDAVTYDSPGGRRAVALVLNRSNTSSYMTLYGSRGSITYDLRLAPVNSYSFIAGVLPVPVDIGDGPFLARIETVESRVEDARIYWTIDPSALSSKAEIGELITVDRGWEARLEDQETECEPSAVRTIEGQDWALNEIASFSDIATKGAASVEVASAFGPINMLNTAIQSVGRTVDRSHLIDCARLHIAVANFQAAREALKEAIDDGQHKDKALDIMNKIRIFEAKLRPG